MNVEEVMNLIAILNKSVEICSRMEQVNNEIVAAGIWTKEEAEKMNAEIHIMRNDTKNHINRLKWLEVAR